MNFSTELNKVNKMREWNTWKTFYKNKYKIMHIESDFVAAIGGIYENLIQYPWFCILFSETFLHVNFWIFFNLFDFAKKFLDFVENPRTEWFTLSMFNRSKLSPPVIWEPFMGLWWDWGLKFGWWMVRKSGVSPMRMREFWEFSTWVLTPGPCQGISTTQLLNHILF